MSFKINDFKADIYPLFQKDDATVKQDQIADSTPEQIEEVKEVLKNCCAPLKGKHRDRLISFFKENEDLLIILRKLIFKLEIPQATCALSLCGSMVGYLFDASQKPNDVDLILHIKRTFRRNDYAKRSTSDFIHFVNESIRYTFDEVRDSLKRLIGHETYQKHARVFDPIQLSEKFVGNCFSILKFLRNIELKTVIEITIIDDDEKIYYFPGLKSSCAFDKDSLIVHLKPLLEADHLDNTIEMEVISTSCTVEEARANLRIRELSSEDPEGTKLMKWVDYSTFREYGSPKDLALTILKNFIIEYSPDQAEKRLKNYFSEYSPLYNLGVTISLINLHLLAEKADIDFPISQKIISNYVARLETCDTLTLKWITVILLLNAKEGKRSNEDEDHISYLTLPAENKRYSVMLPNSSRDLFQQLLHQAQLLERPLFELHKKLLIQLPLLRDVKDSKDFEQKIIQAMFNFLNNIAPEQTLGFYLFLLSQGMAADLFIDKIKIQNKESFFKDLGNYLKGCGKTLASSIVDNIDLTQSFSLCYENLTQKTALVDEQLSYHLWLFSDKLQCFNIPQRANLIHKLMISMKEASHLEGLWEASEKEKLLARFPNERLACFEAIIKAKNNYSSFIEERTLHISLGNAALKILASNLQSKYFYEIAFTLASDRTPECAELALKILLLLDECKDSPTYSFLYLHAFGILLTQTKNPIAFEKVLLAGILFDPTARQLYLPQIAAFINELKPDIKTLRVLLTLKKSGYHPHDLIEMKLLHEPVQKLLKSLILGDNEQLTLETISSFFDWLSEKESIVDQFLDKTISLQSCPSLIGADNFLQEVYLKTVPLSINLLQKAYQIIEELPSSHFNQKVTSFHTLKTRYGMTPDALICLKKILETLKYIKPQDIHSATFNQLIRMAVEGFLHAYFSAFIQLALDRGEIDIAQVLLMRVIHLYPSYSTPVLKKLIQLHLENSISNDATQKALRSILTNFTQELIPNDFELIYQLAIASNVVMNGSYEDKTTSLILTENLYRLRNSSLPSKATDLLIFKHTESLLNKLSSIDDLKISDMASFFYILKECVSLIGDEKLRVSKFKLVHSKMFHIADKMTNLLDDLRSNIDVGPILKLTESFNALVESMKSHPAFILMLENSGKMIYTFQVYLLTFAALVDDRYISPLISLLETIQSKSTLKDVNNLFYNSIRISIKTIESVSSLGILFNTSLLKAMSEFVIKVIPSKPLKSIHLNEIEKLSTLIKKLLDTLLNASDDELFPQIYELLKRWDTLAAYFPEKQKEFLVNIALTRGSSETSIEIVRYALNQLQIKHLVSEKDQLWLQELRKQIQKTEERVSIIKTVAKRLADEVIPRPSVEILDGLSKTYHDFCYAIINLTEVTTLHAYSLALPHAIDTTLKFEKYISKTHFATPAMIILRFYFYELQRLNTKVNEVNVNKDNLDLFLASTAPKISAVLRKLNILISGSSQNPELIYTLNPTARVKALVNLLSSNMKLYLLRNLI